MVTSEQGLSPTGVSAMTTAGINNFYEEIYSKMVTQSREEMEE
jgi:hypothetical protein